jgi:lysophospholipase L1-like esterase
MRGIKPGLIAILAIGLLAVPAIGAVAQSGSPDPTAPDSSEGPSGGWTYLALGDSNVYGPAEACGDCTTYPHLLADRITTELGIPVSLIDGSQWNSLTSRRLLEEIQQDSWGESWELPRDPAVSPREAIAAADLITITVAANDQPWFQDPDPCTGTYDQACIDRIVDPYRTNLDGILREISTIRAGKPTAVRVTTIYNDMIPGPGIDPSWYYSPDFLAESATGAALLLDALNAAITEAAEANGATVVDMHAVAHGPAGTAAIPAGWFSAEYGDLNQAGQDAFAAEIMRLGFAPLPTPGG